MFFTSVATFQEVSGASVDEKVASAAALFFAGLKQRFLSI